MHAGVARPCSVPSWRLSSHEATITPEPDKSHKLKSWYGEETSVGFPPYTEFCMFITGFMNTLAAEETSIRPFNPGAYVSVDDVFLKRS